MSHSRYLPRQNDSLTEQRCVDLDSDLGKERDVQVSDFWQRQLKFLEGTIPKVYTWPELERKMSPKEYNQYDLINKQAERLAAKCYTDDLADALMYPLQGGVPYVTKCSDNRMVQSAQDAFYTVQHNRERQDAYDAWKCSGFKSKPLKPNLYDGLTAQQCLDTFVRMQRDEAPQYRVMWHGPNGETGFGSSGTHEEIAHAVEVFNERLPSERRDVYHTVASVPALTTVQLKVARQMWADQLKAKIREAGEEERNRVVCQQEDELW